MFSVHVSVFGSRLNPRKRHMCWTETITRGWALWMKATRSWRTSRRDELRPSLPRLTR